MKGLSHEFGLLEKQDVDSGIMYSASKSLPLSVKLSGTRTDVLDDSETVDDVEELRRRVKELKSELAKYRLMASHELATKPCPPGDTFRMVRSDGELPTDSAFFPTLDANQPGAQTFAGVEFPVPIVDLTLCAVEKPDSVTVEKLKEMLLENEAELEKEQIANMHLLDEVYRLQSKLTGASPSE